MDADLLSVEFLGMLLTNFHKQGFFEEHAYAKSVASLGVTDKGKVVSPGATGDLFTRAKLTGRRASLGTQERR
jgi:hypothetical protein